MNLMKEPKWSVIIFSSIHYKSEEHITHPSPPLHLVLYQRKGTRSNRHNLDVSSNYPSNRDKKSTQRKNRYLERRSRRREWPPAALSSYRFSAGSRRKITPRSPKTEDERSRGDNSVITSHMTYCLLGLASHCDLWIRLGVGWGGGED